MAQRRWRGPERAAWATLLASVAVLLSSFGFGASVLAGGAPRGATGEASTEAIGSTLTGDAVWVHEHASGALVRMGARGARSASVQKLAAPGAASSKLSNASGGGIGSTLAVLQPVLAAAAVAFGSVVVDAAVWVPGVRGHVPQGRAPPRSCGV